MHMIVLEGPNGKREVMAGVPYRLLPGEKVVSSTLIGEIREDNKKLAKLAGEQGVGVGDLVANLTKAFGIKPCSACEQRKKVLNRLKIQGWKIKREK